MTKLVELTVNGFYEELASSSPAPGGGSIAALSAAIGSGLGQMVYHLTEGKKAWKALDPDIQKKLEDAYQRLIPLGKRVMELIDEDTEAFNAVMAVLTMPKNTDEEKAARSKALAEANLHALLIPLETARTALAVLQELPLFFDYGNRNCYSDMGVAALSAALGVEGAAFNVLINLPGIKDEARAASYKAEILEILGKGEALRAELLEKTKKALNA